MAVLRQQLSGQGYPAAVIDAGVATVYSTVTSPATPAVRQRFFDWRTRYEYVRGHGKIAHFFFGVVVVPFVFFVALTVIEITIQGANYSTLLVADVLYLAFLVYAFRYRRWVFWGMLPGAMIAIFSTIGVIYSFNYLT